MKILLQTEDDLLFLAGDGRVSERVFSPVSEWDLDGELEKQIVRKVTGSHARAISRGNVLHRAFFRTRRAFATPAEAEAYVANAERSFPREGTVYFVTGEGTRKLLDARVNPPVGTVDGANARLYYQVEGGEFTPLEPETIIDGASGILFRMVTDDVGEWFEIGFLSPSLLTGSAADGWTDDIGNLLFRFQRSDDLQTWDYDWTDAPGSPVATGDDWTYWARSTHPRIWKYVTVDLTLTTARAAKSITDLKLFGSTISLPNYPYAMPAAAATLQADLIAAGYAGSTVSSTSMPLTVEVQNWTNMSVETFAVTLSGSNVTDVKNAAGATISLPGYPYAMPSQVTTLQAHLVAAGYPYATARAYDDEWTIFIPDRDTIFSQRGFVATITPADPFTYQGITGTGSDSGNVVAGTAGNLRSSSSGATLEERNRQFGRMSISAGPNHLF